MKNPPQLTDEKRDAVNSMRSYASKVIPDIFFDNVLERARIVTVV